MASELLTRIGALPAGAALRMSRSALDRPLERDAELSVVAITSDACSLGAFQRTHDAAATSTGALARRGSGGGTVDVGAGTVHVLLSLAHAGALVPCEPRRLVNRLVRPLLKALTRRGALAHYFGRDWVSVAHAPVGFVGFAHDSRSGRCTFEAFVAVRHPFARPGRPSFLGKAPSTLQGATGRTFEAAPLQESIASAYADAGARLLVAHTLDDAGDQTEPPTDPPAPPWKATTPEAIGELAAGRDGTGTLRLGGELMASRDAVDRVAARVDALPADATAEEVGRIVDEEFSPPGVVLEGVRDLRNVRDVLVRAR